MVEPTSVSSIQFKPGKLPSNDFAFKNTIYVSPSDFKAFQAENGKDEVFVKIKNFVMKLDALHTLAPNEFAASALQKEAMKISKIDEISMEPFRIKEGNPLN